MSLFKIRIFDLHEKHEVIDSELYFTPIQDPDDDKEWKRFDLYLDTDRIRIDSFREYVLFNKDIPFMCTKIILNDGSCLFGCYAIETFKEYFEKEYLPLVKD